MSSKPRVYLCGGDHHGWALDDDLNQVSRALEGVVIPATLQNCDTVHSVWWNALRNYPTEALAGKRIVCHVSGEPYRYLSDPAFLAVIPLVGLWVAQSAQAKEQLDSLKLPNVLVPYAVDERIFSPLDRSEVNRRNWLEQFGLPAGRYLIGNFHRDTEGRDLRSPKLVKGPDVFLALMVQLHRQGIPLHVVLAGPRRHWLRKKLTAAGVPFTFIGKELQEDDLDCNRLPRETLNQLYNLLDLYVVSSRSEGAPRSILEAAAAQCRIISTPVGIARDVLEPECLYETVLQGLDLIRADAEQSCLARTVMSQYRRVTTRHTPVATRDAFVSLYNGPAKVPVLVAVGGKVDTSTMLTKARPTRLRRWVERWLRPSLKVCLWHKFHKPPYGGGNQFMLALRKALQAKRLTVVENRLAASIDAYVLNSVQFDIPRFQSFQARHAMKLKILHRIDGPIQLIRGCDRALDDQCYDLNRQFASVTVLQSNWTLRQSLALGYAPVRPAIIHNAVDARIFHSIGRILFQRDRKIRLISSSWSNNSRKGGAIYRWIEQNLDWSRFEYTFVGRASEKFDKICQIEPVSSDCLAKILRQHDIYITASQNDPCSNAVIEALACGLPVLYLNDGGHPELVGFGGLPFNSVEEIIPQLHRLVDNYDIFQNLITVPSMDEVSTKYLELIRMIVHEH